MEKNNLLILLHYYTSTYWWSVVEILFIGLLVFAVKKFKVSQVIFFRIAFVLLIVIISLLFLNNGTWSKKITELLFIFISFIAVNSFIKDIKKK